MDSKSTYRELNVLYLSGTWLDKLVVDLQTDLPLRECDKKGEEVQT